MPNTKNPISVSRTLGLGLAACLATLLPLTCRTEPDPPPVSDAVHVGRQSCKACHEVEHERFAGSHHDLAMQEASAQTVLGDFDDIRFTHFGVETGP